MSGDLRTDYISGLRQLADLLDANPDIPLPDNGDTCLTIWVFDEDRERVAAIVRAIPGNANKRFWETSSTAYVDFKMQLGGIGLDVTTDRATVCTRRVVATREEIEEVPDPDVLATVPTIKVTKTVEDVEWDCHPLLAEASS